MYLPGQIHFDILIKRYIPVYWQLGLINKNHNNITSDYNSNSIRLRKMVILSI